MLCDTLLHTATHCNTLQHTATHCNTHGVGEAAERAQQEEFEIAAAVQVCVLKCLAVCYSVLKSVAVYCIVQGIVVCCSMLLSARSERSLELLLL